MMKFTLVLKHAMPHYFELFEAELAKLNLKPRVIDKSISPASLTIAVNTQSQAEEQLVRELASLCFGLIYTAQSS